MLQRVFHPDRVLETVLRINAKKSGGPYLLNQKVLAATLPFVITELAALYKRAFLSSVLPQETALAVVVPVPKGKQDYRPISLVNPALKVLDAVVAPTLDALLEEGRIYSRYQFGFRKRRSTIHAHIRIEELLYAYYKAKVEAVVIVYLDMAKAFDSCTHEGIIGSLRDSGLPKSFVNFVNISMKNRRFVVNNKGCFSQPQSIFSGVVQGGKTSPMIFSALISSVVDRYPALNPTLFADDLSLVIPISSIERVNVAQAQLNYLVDDLSRVGLEVNAGKSQMMCIKLKSELLLPHIFSIGGDSIPISDKAKYLGSVIDSQLNFSENANKCRASAASALYALNKLIPHSMGCKKARIILYDSCVKSRNEFDGMAFLPLRAIDKNKLESCQRLFTKSLFVEDYSYDKRLEKLNWLTVVQELEAKIVIFMYKCYKTKRLECFRVKEPNSRYVLRSSSALMFEIPKLPGKFSHFIMVNGPRLFNLLPESLRKECYDRKMSVKLFKQRVVNNYLHR